MSAISIHAVLDGVVHPLDTRERTFAWFGRPPAPADYFVSYRGTTYEFDGIPFRQPVSPSDLVAKALDRIPGNAPRRGILDWSLFDDFTRGQCGWLALALAKRVGGRPMIAGVLPGLYHDIPQPIETDTEWYLLGDRYMEWFMHAGVLVGDRVYCAQGRSSPGLWAYGISRSEDATMCGIVTADTLRRGLDPLPDAVVDIIPDVVDLLVQLVGDEDEPRHPNPWGEYLADLSRSRIKEQSRHLPLANDEDLLADVRF